MSVHVEWMRASITRPELVPQGWVGPDSQEVDQGGAIVISENELVVVEGDMHELQTFAARTLRCVQPHRHSELERLINRARSAASRGDSDEVLGERLNEALDVALTILGREDLR